MSKTCVDCGINKALPEDELCAYCLLDQDISVENDLQMLHYYMAKYDLKELLVAVAGQATAKDNAGLAQQIMDLVNREELCISLYHLETPAKT